MEFRKCPSCKASVLEDDVADCPFCGASMSGKPGAKPAAKPAAGPAKAAAPGAAKPAGPSAKGLVPDKAPAAGGARSRPIAEPEPERPQDEGDPFEVDPRAHQQAAQVSVKQAKGRTVEVKCPMCETVGFIAPSQAGKDVKCCNPSCRLPIFKAPKLPPEVVAEPEKPKGLSALMLSIIGIVAVALVGGGVWYFVLREEPKPIVGPIDNGPTVPEPPKSPDKDTVNQVVLPTRHVVSTVTEIQKLSLEEIAKVIVLRDIRSKPYGKQLATEALLAVGDLAKAKDQLAGMGAGGVQYTVGPLAILAQLQLDAGDKAGAEASLKEAVTQSAKLPDVGRSPLDAVAILAATLVRFDRSAEAVQLLGRYARKDSDGRAGLSLMWRASLDRGSFDIAKESSLSHLELCGKPLWVSTAVHLCRHGQWDQALTWAKSAPDQVTQDAALAACAGMMAARLVRTPDPALETQLKTATDSASLSAKVRMLVAAAEVRHLSGDKGITAASVAPIAVLLASTPIPPAVPMPAIKAIYDSKGMSFAGLPDPAPGTSLALAFGDIADLQMQLGDTAGGWATQAKAQEVLRSVSPSPALAQELVDQCANNTEIVKSQLDTALKLGNDGAKKLRALSQYRVQCEAILNLANDRFAIQQAFLRRSILHGLHQEVWQYAQEMELKEMTERDPYRSRSGLLADLYYATYFQEKARKDFAIQTYGEYSAEEKKAVGKAESTLGQLAAANSVARTANASKVADMLKPLYVGATIDRQILDGHVLGEVSRLAGKSLGASYTYLQRFGLADPAIKEDSLRLLAGMSIVQGKGPELWKLMEADLTLTSTDRAAAYLGYLEGIQATGAK
jgi:hypothetical protein